MVFLYFAYGSNLLRQRLLCDQTGSKTFKGVGKVKDFELRFKGYNSSGWKGHPATIEACPGSSVWGVVWELEDRLAPALDIQESSYDRFTVPVLMDGGQTLECVTYKLSPTRLVDETGAPSPHYLDIIQRGARQNGLPLEYRRWLENHAHNKYAGPVPLYSHVIGQVRDDPSCNEDLDRLTKAGHTD